MALVECTECGESVSDQAAACVNCGAPIASKSTIQPVEAKAAGGNWFNSAAKSAVLNGLWLGPLNIFYWFQSGRFDDAYYAVEARLANTDLDAVIAIVLVFEMLIMLLSLFTVHAIFKLANAAENTFSWIIFLVLATVLWAGLSMLFGL
jgi:hypothetical protein